MQRGMVKSYSSHNFLRLCVYACAWVFVCENNYEALVLSGVSDSTMS